MNVARITWYPYQLLPIEEVGACVHCGRSVGFSEYTLVHVADRFATCLTLWRGRKTAPHAELAT